MINKTYLYFLFILVLSSCNTGNGALMESSYADSIAIKTNEVIRETNDLLFLKEYYLLSSHLEDGVDVVTAYNGKSHTLDRFGVQADSVCQIKLDTEGTNAVLPRLTGIHSHSKDSVWLYSQGFIYLVDDLGEVKKKINLSVLKQEEILIQSNYAISRANLYYNKHRNSLFYTTASYAKDKTPQFYVNEYVLADDHLNRYELSPSIYDPELTLYSWMNAPNVTFSEDKILYNYPIESNVYSINLKDGSKHVYGGKSKYTENNARRLSLRPSLQDVDRHKIENIHFYEMIYNPYLDVYFRLHADRTDFSTDQDSFILFFKKDFYLTIFNSKFEILHEGKLPSNRYSFIDSWCGTGKGLLMFAGNFFLDKTTGDNTLLFDIIEPQK